MPQENPIIEKFITENARLQDEINLLKEKISFVNGSNGDELVSGNKKKTILDRATVSIWEVDLSLLHTNLIELANNSRTSSFKEIMMSKWEMLEHFLSHIRFLDVNDYTLNLYKAANKAILFDNILRLFRQETWEHLVDFAEAMVSGAETYTGESVNYTLDGTRIPIILTVNFHNGDNDYSKVVFSIFDISRLKETEELLRNSEQRLLTVLKAIPDRMYMIDREGFYLDSYKSETNLTKFPFENVLGLHLKEVFPEELATHYINEIASCLDTGKIKIVEYTLVLDEQDHYFESRIVPATEFEVLTLEVDVTERRKAEIELNKSYQQYRVLFESANDAILIIDPENECILAVNNKAEEIYGFGPDEMKGIHLSLLTNDEEKVKKPIKLATEEKSFKNFETVHYKKSGQEIHLLINGSLIEYGGKDAILIINHDITELKWAEQIKEATYKISQLALVSESLDQLYASIHSIIGGLMLAKNLYIALYESETDILSYPYFVDEQELVPRPGKPRKGLTEYVLKTGKPLLTSTSRISELVNQGDLELAGPLNSDWLGVPLKTKDKTIGVLAVQRYHTSVKFTSEDKDILIFVSEQVAMAIDSRKKEDELRKAKNSAEASSRVKSALLANMSHEFKTPMNAILNFAGLLKDRLEDKDANSMATSILNSGNRLFATLDSIMYLAQIESNSISLDIKKTDISKSITPVLDSYAQDLKNKALNYTTDLAYNIFANVDEILLKQVCKYLLDNALKFTTTGIISVHVRESIIADIKYAEIEISDTGLGISQENQDLIFQEFRQISYGYGRSHEGFGLGLTLSRKMTELMNGRISVVSEPGKGSSFFLRFALVEEVSADNNASKLINDQKLKEADESVVVNQIPEVLIVEDNQVNMELTVMFLKGVCKTDRARDGLSAIKLAEGKQYDAILMDINLGPGMNGLEAATEIRKIPGYVKVPIVAVTGYTMSGDREKMLQGGCDDYLAKPFDRKSIVGKVKEVLHLD